MWYIFICLPLLGCRTRLQLNRDHRILWQCPKLSLTATLLSHLPCSLHTASPPSLPQALWLVKMLKGELELPVVHEMKEDVRLQQG